MGSCDYLSIGRPHALEQLVSAIHQVQTFSCPTSRCQFRSTLLIVLAHRRICSDPSVFNPKYNDFRRVPNCREELIMYRHPNRHVEGVRADVVHVSDNVTLV